MANMTVAAPVVKSAAGGKRLKSVTFTHTAAGTADGSVASSPITGTLLRVLTNDGGDASWDLSFTASGAVIWEQTALGTGAQTYPLGICWDGTTPDGATDACMWGIPVFGEAITCTTANMSGSGTGPVITIIYREE